MRPAWRQTGALRVRIPRARGEDVLQPSQSRWDPQREGAVRTAHGFGRRAHRISTQVDLCGLYGESCMGPKLGLLNFPL